MDIKAGLYIPSMKKPKDLSKINVNDMQELLWWSCHLGTSPEKLLAIVRRTGDVAVKAHDYIRNENLLFFHPDKKDL